MTSEITNWRKSTRSGNTANCVEVGTSTRVVGIRDSKDRNGPALLVSPAAWQSFTTALRANSLAR